MNAPTSIAVVGAGYWGPNWVRVLSEHPRAELAEVCDLRPGRLEYIRQRFPGVPTTDSIDEVLADNTIAAVVLATPVSTHEALGSRILEAGKHLLVEKPLADSEHAAAALVDTARRAGRVLATGHIFVYHPAVQAMVRELEAGTIGDFQYAHSTRMNLAPPESEVDVVWDLAVHDFSILLALKRAEPVAIRAVGRRFVHPSLTDAAFITTQFADGSLSSHHVGWLSAERVRDFFVAGNNGSLRFDDASQEGKLRIVDAGVDTRRGGGGQKAVELAYQPGEVREVPLEPGEPLNIECTQFLQAICEGRQPAVDGVAGLLAVRMIEAVHESLRNHGAVVALRGEPLQPRMGAT